MELLNKLTQILKKPFPENESFAYHIKVSGGISLFITFFLYVFSPNDMSDLKTNKFWICLGFGIVAFVSMLTYELVVTYLLKIKPRGANFTFAKWILYMIGLMLFISLTNFLFIRLLYFGYIQWELFPHMLHGTFTIGLFPIVMIGGYALTRQEKKYQNIAKVVNEKAEVKSAIAETNDLNIFGIPVERIRYIEALQNYVKIGYLNSENILQEQTERATLKYIMDKVQDSSIVKCHRSYLVNRATVISTSGNAQGLLLSLSDCEKKIPVSRSYVPSFRTK